MSLRTIFFFASIVVMLYLLIITFMFNPFHATKSGYFGNHYMNHFGFRQVRNLNWCKELRWQSPPASKPTALVSYPGSGNTWLRYLLQQATGVMTGSIYMDYGLRVHGFPGENVTDGSVLVVKTHEAPPIEPDKFKSAILLIRNPRDAILADFNRLHKGHIGTAPKSAFMAKSYKYRKSDWTTYVSTQLIVWESLHRMWLTRFPASIHIVFYELLVKDTRKNFEGVLQFLNHTVTKESMECAIINKEGIYRRKKKLQDFDPFTKDMYIAMNEVRNRVFNMVLDYRKKHNSSIRNNKN